jgi:hypothetical protein
MRPVIPPKSLALVAVSALALLMLPVLFAFVVPVEQAESEIAAAATRATPMRWRFVIK